MMRGSSCSPLWTFFVCLVLLCKCVLSANSPLIGITKFSIDLTDIKFAVNSTGDVTNILILDSSAVLWNSVDEGMHWNKVNITRPTGSGCYPTGLFQDEDDSMKIIVAPRFPCTGLWVSTNGGVSFNWFDVQSSFFTLSWHPTISNYLIGTTQGGQIFASTDNGDTWTPFAQGLQVEWGNFLDDELPDSSIYVLDLNGNLLFYPSLQSTQPTVILTNVIRFIMESPFLYVGVNTLADGFHLMVNNIDADPTLTSSYLQTMFPFKVYPFAYVLIDSPEHSTWFATLTSQEDEADLYVSNHYGTSFALAFEDVYTYNYGLDFMPLASVEGYYIANKELKPNNRDPKESQLKTQITYDHGGTWRPLAAPAFDYNGNPITCEGTCSLNLFGPYDYPLSNYAPFYSSENAVGLILASGNYGDILSDVLSATATYFSRDGGHTWVQLLQGSFIYEFGDHGGILIMAQLGIYTNRVYYSLDEGLTFNNFTVPTQIYVTNIIAEPTGTGRKFIMYGEDISGKALLYGLNLARLQPRTCVDDDYELFSIAVLGSNVTYSRRKQASNCFNDRAYEHVVSTEILPCTIEDYECDYQFVPSYSSGSLTCTLAGTLPADPPAFCPPGTNYIVPNGYRLVAGDTCMGGLNLNPTIKACPAAAASTTGSPSTPDSTPSKAPLVVVIIILLVSVIGATVFFVYKNDYWRNKVLRIFGMGEDTGPDYSRLNTNTYNDEEFGIGGDGDLEDEVEEDAKVLHDNDISATASSTSNNSDFNPRS